jgi:hypothetical protein
VPDLRSRIPVALPATLVAAVTLAAIALVGTQHWRKGAVLLGGALLMAAVLRMAVPPDRVGLLAIRGRAVDVLFYSGFGMMIVLLAATITRGSLSAG